MDDEDDGNEVDRRFERLSPSRIRGMGIFSWCVASRNSRAWSLGCGNEVRYQIVDSPFRASTWRDVTYQAEATYDEIGPRHISAAYKPTRDSDGNTQGWVALVEDITAPKKPGWLCC
jgi:hypothetical protein